MARVCRRGLMFQLGAVLSALGVLCASQSALARDGQEAKVAVAANFTAPAKEIAVAFEKATGSRLVLSMRSTASPSCR